jgi:hypothetical protein
MEAALALMHLGTIIRQAVRLIKGVEITQARAYEQWLYGCRRQPPAGQQVSCHRPPSLPPAVCLPDAVPESCRVGPNTLACMLRHSDAAVHNGANGHAAWQQSCEATALCPLYVCWHCHAACLRRRMKRSSSRCLVSYLGEHEKGHSYSSLALTLARSVPAAGG